MFSPTGVPFVFDFMCDNDECVAFVQYSLFPCCQFSTPAIVKALTTALSLGLIDCKEWRGDHLHRADRGLRSFAFVSSN